MWLSLLCKIKGSPTWKGKKDLSMNRIGTWCCRKVCPWSVLCERKVDRTQGMQGSIVLFIISCLNNHVITPCVIGPLSLRPMKILHCPTPPCSHPPFKGWTPYLSLFHPAGLYRLSHSHHHIYIHTILLIFTFIFSCQSFSLSMKIT